MPSKEGRIAHNGWANCNSPLRVCYPNVGKYHVNTCKYVCKHTKKHHGHGMRAFACVVGANCNSPTPQFVHTAICPYCKFIPYCKIHPCCKIHPHYNSPTPQFAYITPLKLEGQGGAKGVMCRFPDGKHREGGRGLWYSLFCGEGLFSFS